MDRKAHWEAVYTARQPSEVGWYQVVPTASLKLIEAAGVDRGAAVIDVGAGASTLVDELLARGYTRLTVLDISAAALAAAKNRLGSRAAAVNWVVADVTAFHPAERYDLWHDRAVFHFLTDAGDRRKYMQAVDWSLRPGGQLIISTFAKEGPEQCSGLDVVRYDAPGLALEVGAGYELVEWYEDIHVTPGGGEQKFLFCRFLKKQGAAG